MPAVILPKVVSRSAATSWSWAARSSSSAVSMSLRRVSRAAMRWPSEARAEAEQQALLRWQKIVWLTPVHWYSVPAMMKHWIDQVLALGWAYGHGGEALRGKTCWWVCSAGGTDPAYALREMHRRPFQDYVPPLEQTARFCGMQWWSPFVVHGAHDITEQELLHASATLQQRCEEFLTAALPEGEAP